MFTWFVSMWMFFCDHTLLCWADFWCVIYIRLLFGIACLAYHTAIKFALYQPLYHEFIVIVSTSNELQPHLRNLLAHSMANKVFYVHHTVAGLPHVANLTQLIQKYIKNFKQLFEKKLTMSFLSADLLPLSFCMDRASSMSPNTYNRQCKQSISI